MAESHKKISVSLKAETLQILERVQKQQRYQLEIESTTRITVPSALAAMARPR